MAEANNRSGLVQMVGGISQSLVAALIFSVIGSGLIAIGWVKAENLYDPSSWPIWAVGFGTLLVLAVSTRAAWLASRRWFVQETISRPYLDRIGIIVAQFEGDADNFLQETIMENLGKELNKAANVTKWPAALAMGDGVDHDRARKADKKAQKWLNKKHNDVLVWGRRKSDGVVSLRFTARAGLTSNAVAHRLTENLDLPVAAIAQLGGVIAVQAANLAAPAVTQAGTYLVPKMREISDRLKPLADHPPENFGADERAWLRFSFALARQTLGEQAGNSDDLQEAIEAYRAVLDDWTREKAPHHWATIQNNLGNALGALGEGEAKTGRLEEAVRSYHNALKVWKVEKVPLDWATIQNNLGNALKTLGERESGAERLKEGITAYHAALQIRTRENVPLDWAATQNNLGTALQALGEREASTEQLEEAITAYRSALKELTREKVPLNWATTQNNLGAALQTLGEREASTKRLEKAVVAYKNALKEWAREKMPINWAMTQNNLGNAFLALGRFESNPEQVKKAISAFTIALEEFTKADATYYMGKTRDNLAHAEAALARLHEAK